MLMVIFGAGASYDSSPTYSIGMAPPGAGEQSRDHAYYRPPLAKELFANRPLFIQAIEAFPQCKPIVPRLRDPAVISGQASIEARLHEIEEEARACGQGRQELAAVRCYLQIAISQCERNWRAHTARITNHLWLLREIRCTHKTDEPVCLVTFNYDTLIEDALADLGMEIKQMDDYTRKPGLFHLFKLHGSIDWGREVDIPFPANMNLDDSHSVLKYLIEHATPEQLTNRFARCNPLTMRPDGARHALFPAIAIPVEKKRVFECPEYTIEELQDVLSHITKILVVGWRPTENHFLDLLKRH